MSLSICIPANIQLVFLGSFQVAVYFSVTGCTKNRLLPTKVDILYLQIVAKLTCKESSGFSKAFLVFFFFVCFF